MLHCMRSGPCELRPAPPSGKPRPEYGPMDGATKPGSDALALGPWIASPGPHARLEHVRAEFG